MFLSASETHNRRNVNRSVEESLAGARAVLGRAREAGLRCEGVVSTAFGCPYEGHVPPARVLEIAAPYASRRRGDRLRRHHRDGQPGPGGGLLQDARGRSWGRGRADRPLPQHPRRRALPTCSPRSTPASRASSRASASSAGARCRPARPATSPPRTSSRCSTRWASTPAWTCPRCWRARAAPRRSSGARWAATRWWPGRSTGAAPRGRLRGPPQPARRSWPAERALALGGGLLERAGGDRDAELLHVDLHLERMCERGPGGGVHHPLGATYGDVGVGQQFLDERVGGVLELGRRHDAVHQADVRVPPGRRSSGRS